MADELNDILENLLNPHFLARAQTNLKNPDVRAAANSLFADLGLDINQFRATDAPQRYPAFISQQFSGNIAELPDDELLATLAEIPDDVWTIILSL